MADPAFFVLAILVVVALARTPYGRRLFALGSNPRAAALALVEPIRMWTITYALSALFAAVAGVLLLGFTGSAYGDVGQPYLFQTIAPVVIGGTALVGGRGSFIGTVAGAIVLTELTRSSSASGWSRPWSRRRSAWSSSSSCPSTDARRMYGTRFERLAGGAISTIFAAKWTTRL